jgi:tight adherence protein C
MLFSDPNIPLFLASLAFVVVCLLAMGIIIHFRGVRYRREIIDKIRSADDDLSVIEKDAPSLDLPSGSGNAFVKILSAIGVKANPGRSADDADIKLKFLKAGLRGRNVATVFWGAKFLLAIVLPAVFLFVTITFVKTMLLNHMLLGVMFLALVGLFLPDLWLRFKTSARKDRLAKGFPDALDLMVVCVEAGMGLDAAISRVGEEVGLSHPELSRELNLLNLELRAGKSRQTALRNLSDRMDIDEVNSLVTLLVQTDRFGTSVAQALRVFSDSFRTARYQKAEEIAAKIGTKLLFPLVICIFPAIFLVVLAPAVIRIYRVLVTGG